MLFARNGRIAYSYKDRKCAQSIVRNATPFLWNQTKRTGASGRDSLLTRDNNPKRRERHPRPPESTRLLVPVAILWLRWWRILEELPQVWRIKNDDGPVTLQSEVDGTWIDQICLTANERRGR